RALTVHPVDDVLERVGPIWLLHGLGGEANVFLHILAWQLLDPRRLVAQALPVHVHLPQQGRNPGEPAFEHANLQGRELLEHAFEHEAGDVHRVEGGPQLAGFDVVARVAGGGGRRIDAGAFTTEVHGHGEAIALAGLVDWVEEAVAERPRGTAAKHDRADR